MSAPISRATASQDWEAVALSVYRRVTTGPGTVHARIRAVAALLQETAESNHTAGLQPALAMQERLLKAIPGVVARGPDGNGLGAVELADAVVDYISRLEARVPPTTKITAPSTPTTAPSE